MRNRNVFLSIVYHNFNYSIHRNIPELYVLTLYKKRVKKLETATKKSTKITKVQE